jgi:twinkle protein
VKKKNKSEILPGKLPCLRVAECGSTDARVAYKDGTSYCFSCQTYFPASYGFVSSEEEENEFEEMSVSTTVQEISQFDSRGFPSRGIERHVAEFFKCKVGYDASRQVIEHYYPYGVASLSGYKVRKLPKTFHFVGELSGLFGQMLFSTGKRLIITEGELDAMTVAQAAYEKYGQIYPVVSVSSAANMKEVLKQRDWIRGFEEVVIWFDNDEPGQKAAEEAAKIIGGVVKIAKSTEKDASDTYVKASQTDAKGFLVQGPGAAAVMDAVFRAKRWSPAGIVSSANTWEAYKAEKASEYIPYAPCLQTLNEKIYGRRLGSVSMFTSGTGMGKTLLLKEDQYHLYKTRPAEERIGVLSLEESIKEAVENIMALEANKRIQLPDVEMTDDEERALWEATMADDRFMFLDHQGSVEDSSLISKMEFMALSGCKYIYLDHVTIAVSESEGDSINSAIDKLMSDLLKLAKRCNVWIGVVSHLRKMGTNQKSFEEGAVPTDDDLKGSGSLKQVPMQIIAISRNKMEEDQQKMHTSKVWILKDRFTGRTGAAGSYIFQEDTGRLVAVTADDFEPSL